jgi:hypothetical protein
MALTKIPRSVRAQSGTQVMGVGRGSGTALSELWKMGTAGANMLDFRARADTASGDARIMYARLHQYGVGGGEAVRAYAFANAANVATGGTLNGIHASVSIAAAGSISGQASAGRFTLEASAATRTLTGALSSLIVDSNVATGNTMPTIHGFLRFTNTGAVGMGNLMVLPAAAANGTIFAAHTTQAMTHSIRIIDSAGTPYYVMCTNAATNRS